MSDEYTIEQALGDYQSMDGEPLDYIDLLIMLAELAELRRKAAWWDEGRQRTQVVLEARGTFAAADFAFAFLLDNNKALEVER